ncbi:sodium/proton antiporter, NhaA family [human gut metagenome]|uniref:Sodium/proton antiporter, NhaA family n=1 Tax=human gut metagenome TaxID=408170 RepID=K1T3U4_9ZZZZ
MRSGRRIIGFDMVEVTPASDDRIDAITGARILWKLCGLTLRSHAENPSGRMGIFTRFGWIRRLRSVVFGVRRFMQAPWAGGVVLLTCVAIAMLLANLPATALYYHHLLETELSAMVHSPEGVIDWIFPAG